MKRLYQWSTLLLWCSLSFAQEHPGMEDFLQRAVSEYELDEATVRAVLADAEFKQSIVDAISRPAEGKPWHEYRPIFLNQQRIDEGVAFWREHRKLIESVSDKYGVEPQIIVAIIGVETLYGRITGSYRVIDALATLGFYYPQNLSSDRSPFFSSELLEFIKLSGEEGLPPLEVTGSYAGAMGMGQFMPSSYRQYAVDFDQDGVRDLWRSTPDVVASVANYLHRYGWEHGGPVTRQAFAGGDADFSVIQTSDFRPAMTVLEIHEKGFRSAPDLDPERQGAVLRLQEAERETYWLTFKNFYVITRYNRSPRYAMAVYELSEAIRNGMTGP